MEQSTIVGLAVGAAVAIGVAVGFTFWNTGKAWNAIDAAEQIEFLTDDYNEAIAEQPADWRRATFVFDVKANKRLEAFAAKHGDCVEFTQWSRDFEVQCKRLRKALRKI